MNKELNGDDLVIEENLEFHVTEAYLYNSKDELIAVYQKSQISQIKLPKEIISISSGKGHHIPSK